MVVQIDQSMKFESYTAGRVELHGCASLPAILHCWPCNPANRHLGIIYVKIVIILGGFLELGPCVPQLGFISANFKPHYGENNLGRLVYNIDMSGFRSSRLSFSSLSPSLSSCFLICLLVY